MSARFITVTIAVTIASCVLSTAVFAQSAKQDPHDISGIWQLSGREGTPFTLSNEARVSCGSHGTRPELLDVGALGDRERRHAPFERHLLQRVLVVAEPDHRSPWTEARDH